MLRQGSIGLLIGVLMMGACAEDPRLAGSSSPVRSPDQTIEFSTWCEQWKIECPQGAPQDIPINGQPWNVEQWRAALGVLLALAETPSSIQVTRADVQADALSVMARAWGLESTLAQLDHRLDLMGFDYLQVRPGNPGVPLTQETFPLTLHATARTTIVVPSGLTVEQSDDFQLGIDADRNVRMQGLRISPRDTEETVSIDAMTVTDTNVLRWRGQDVSVSHVPIAFFLAQYAASNEISLPSPTFNYRDLVSAIHPFVTWLTSGERNIEVLSDTFQRLANELPVVSPTPWGRGLGAVAASITGLLSTSESRAQQLLLARSDRSVICRFGSLVELIPEREFGIKSVTKLSETSFRTSFFGVRVRLPLLPLVPAFRIRQIDFEPTKIILYDVPLLGRYEYDMSSNSLPDIDLTPSCRS